MTTDQVSARCSEVNMLPLGPGLSAGLTGPLQEGGGDTAHQIARALVACDEAGVQGWLARGMDPDMRMTGRHSPLTLVITRATSDRWEAVARLLLEAGASPNCRGPGGTPLLSLLVKSCSSDLVRLALDRGAAHDDHGTNGESPLLAAVHYRQVDCLRLLLDHGSNPNSMEKDGNSALMWAAGRSNGLGLQRSLACVRLLLTHGADPTFQNPRGYTPLMAASIIREREVVRALLNAGAPPDARDAREETALIKTTDADAVNVVEELLASGANVNIANNVGNTAIMSAVSVEVTITLLRGGADPGLAAKDGTTALHQQAINDRVEVARALVGHGAPLEARDAQGNTPLQTAVRARSHNVTNLLMEAGADSTTTNLVGASLPMEALLPWDYFATHDVFPALNTPTLRAELTHYVGSGAVQAEWVLMRLLECGADPGLAGEKGVTPIMLASAAGQEWLLRLLLDAGVMVDAKDARGRTALAYACRWGEEEAVEVLLAHHTPVNTLDSHYNLPIFYAAHAARTPILLALMVQFAFFMCSI